MTDVEAAEFDRQMAAWVKHAKAHKKTIIGFHWHQDALHLEVTLAGGEWKPFADAIADTPTPEPPPKMVRRTFVQEQLL